MGVWVRRRNESPIITVGVKNVAIITVGVKNVAATKQSTPSAFTHQGDADGIF